MALSILLYVPLDLERVNINEAISRLNLTDSVVKHKTPNGSVGET